MMITCMSCNHMVEPEAAWVKHKLTYSANLSILFFEFCAQRQSRLVNLPVSPAVMYTLWAVLFWGIGIWPLEFTEPGQGQIFGELTFFGIFRHVLEAFLSIHVFVPTLCSTGTIHHFQSSTVMI